MLKLPFHAKAQSWFLNGRSFLQFKGQRVASLQLQTLKFRFAVAPENLKPLNIEPLNPAQNKRPFAQPETLQSNHLNFWHLLVTSQRIFNN